VIGKIVVNGSALESEQCNNGRQLIAVELVQTQPKENIMNAYSIALFLHIVGALGIFVALGLEWTGLWQIRSAMTPQQVGGWMRILKGVRKFGFASMLTTVVTGI
jgi:hypothetical protein